MSKKNEKTLQQAEVLTLKEQNLLSGRGQGSQQRRWRKNPAVSINPVLIRKRARKSATHESGGDAFVNLSGRRWKNHH